MKWSRMLTLYGVHCEGEVGRVITGGLLGIPGKTMIDKLNYINNEDDWIKRFTLQEPRGCATQSVNILLPPVTEEADAAFIVLQPDQAHALSGSNTMCISTAVLESGMLPMQEPITNLTFDTAVGHIKVVAECENGKVKTVQADMCPSFAEILDAEIDVPGMGKITVDVGFGGCFFCMVDVNQVGLKITPECARQLVEKGDIIKQAADAQLKVQHPDEPSFNHIEYVMFTDEYEDNGNRICKNATLIYPGRVDRSPCGTGTSSRMAVMYAKGQLKETDKIYTESIIGGRFEDSIAGTLKMSDGRTAIIPRLKGRSWIYNLEYIGVDSSDPFPTGYMMSDTWGPQAK